MPKNTGFNSEDPAEAAKFGATALIPDDPESLSENSTTAATIQDAQKLIEAGFEYVCDFNDTKLFRKRK